MISRRSETVSVLCPAQGLAHQGICQYVLNEWMTGCILALVWAPICLALVVPVVRSVPPAPTCTPSFGFPWKQNPRHPSEGKTGNEESVIKWVTAHGHWKLRDSIQTANSELPHPREKEQGYLHPSFPEALPPTLATLGRHEPHYLRLCPRQPERALRQGRTSAGVGKQDAVLQDGDGAGT